MEPTKVSKQPRLEWEQLTCWYGCADGMQFRSNAIVPSTMRIKPILRGVNRGPEKRGACVTLFAHLKVVLGGVSGVGEVKGSSYSPGRCHMSNTVQAVPAEEREMANGALIVRGRRVSDNRRRKDESRQLQQLTRMEVVMQAGSVEL